MIFISIKESSFSVVNLFNTDTGENFGQISNMEDCEVESETKIDYAEDKYGSKIFPCNTTHTYTMTFNTDEPITTEKFCKIIGMDMSNAPDIFDIQFVKYIQVRKHKKRRINKKWLKRYGYKEIVLNSKDWKVKNNADGTIEFIK